MSDIWAAEIDRHGVRGGVVWGEFAFWEGLGGVRALFGDSAADVMDGLCLHVVAKSDVARLDCFSLGSDYVVWFACSVVLCYDLDEHDTRISQVVILRKMLKIKI